MIKLHQKSLEKHKDVMWSTLIYPIHRSSANGTLVRREFYSQESLEETGGNDPVANYKCDYYIKHSDGNISSKYVLTEEMISKLPIRVKESTELLDRKTHEVVQLPTTWNTFRIIPLKQMNLHEMIQPFIFNHTHPELYEMYVVTGFASMIGRVPIWISGYRAFGKSSVFKTMNYVFDKVPLVESPNTVPAFYKHIPDTGIMVLDEMTKKDTDSAYNIHYILNMAGDHGNTKVQVQTGGSAAYGTNVPKNVWNCSFVCLMNLVEDYGNREKFAEYMFHNNVSLDRRYIKIRIDRGELDLEQFNEWSEYNLTEKAELIKMAKTMEWYKPHFNYTKGEWSCGLDEDSNPELVEKGMDIIKKSRCYKQTHYEGLQWIVKTMQVYCRDNVDKYYAMIKLFVNCMEQYKDALQDDYDGDSCVDSTAHFESFKESEVNVPLKDKVTENGYTFNPFKKEGDPNNGGVIKTW